MSRRGAAALVAAAVLATGCAAGGNAPAPTAAPAPSGVAAPAPSGPTPLAAPLPARSVPEPGPSAYLALGDSVAAGVGALSPRSAGYVPLLAERLRRQLGCPSGPGCPLTVHNLAVGGATTATLLRDQLPAAVEVLASRDVRLVTVTVGGNDVVGPVLSACAAGPARCGPGVNAALQRVDAGVQRVLSTLTRAAGERTVVAVMTYYDPVPSCDLAALAPLSAVVLEGDGATPGLNQVLRRRAREVGAVVVETAGLLQPRDLVGGPDCLHPGPTGHARIAEAFADAVADRLRP